MRKPSVDYRSLDPKTFIRRSEIAACLEQRHGIKFTTSRFDKFVTEGAGPQFTKLSRMTLYRIAWLDEWLEAEVERRLHRPHAKRRAASEHARNAGA